MSEYKTKLKNKISIIFSFLREIFKGIDNRIYEQLNEEYEEEMLILAGMIPNDWIAGFYESLEMFFDLTACVNVRKLANAVIKHNKARIWFNINSHDIFMNNCVYGKGWSPDAVKAVENICIKFKPIFNAIDKLFSNPNNVLSRVADITENSNENEDILNCFM